MIGRQRFRHALATKLGGVLTPDVAAWLESQCFPTEVGYVATAGILAGTEMRDRIHKLIDEAMRQPQVECPVREYFAPGMYAREITIHKGTVLVGAVHKTQNMAVLSRGRLRLVTEHGTTEISAEHENYYLTVMPGGMNAALALEDSVWTNYFPTTETDPEKVIAELCELPRNQLLGGSNNRQLLTSGAVTQIGG